MTYGYMRLIEPEPNSGCWLWMGAQAHGGYGKIKWNRKTWLAHRLVYIHQVGSIPAGLTLDHLCRIRTCVNPKHMEPVSLRTNLLRGDTLAAKFARITHCINGHSLQDALSYGRYHRLCRVCKNANQTAYVKRLKCT